MVRVTVSSTVFGRTGPKENLHDAISLMSGLRTNAKVVGTIMMEPPAMILNIKTE